MLKVQERRFHQKDCCAIHVKAWQTIQLCVSLDLSEFSFIFSFLHSYDHHQQCIEEMSRQSSATAAFVVGHKEFTEAGFINLLPPVFS